MVTPWTCSRRISAKSCSVSDRVKYPVGSSKMISFALRVAARAAATSCCCPICRAPRKARASNEKPISSRIRWALRSIARSFRRESRASSSPRNMLAATVRCGQSTTSWWTTFMPSAIASCGDPRATGFPRHRISPLVRAIAPDRSLIKVDLPAPFSPTTAWTSPCMTSRSTAFRA